MKKKGFTAEQIIGKLSEAEVLLSQGEHGGGSEPKTQRHGADLLPLDVEVQRDAGRSCELEKENGRLKRLVAER